MCDDHADLFFMKRDVKARKEHKCSSCGFLMPKGYLFWQIKMLFDGKFETYRICNHCEAVSDMLQEEDSCITPDYIIEEIQENAFDYFPYYVLIDSSFAQNMKEEFYQKDVA